VSRGTDEPRTDRRSPIADRRTRNEEGAARLEASGDAYEKERRSAIGDRRSERRDRPFVAMITSVADRCGIAAYSGALLEALAPLADCDRIGVPGEEASDAALAALAERANRADVIHIQHEFTFFRGYLPHQTTLFDLAARFRRPLILTAHSVLPLEALMHVADERRPMKRLLKRLLTYHPGLRRAVERSPYALAEHVIVHTNECLRRLVRAGISRDRIHLLPGGIPALPEAGELPGELDRFMSRPTVIIAGYVTPNKGYETALAALRLLPEEVGLVIAGGTRVPTEAPYLGHLAERITADGLDARVRITGFLPEPQLAAVLRRSTLAAVPHLEATGSYSVTLPLAAGRAVVASDLACFREIAEADGGITLVPTGDVSALARAISQLLTDDSRRARLEAAARRYAGERTWANVAARTVALYERVSGLGSRVWGTEPSPPEPRAPRPETRG
jgi:glycosyltransferase involved in cell wall biosynthesis